MKMSRWLLLLCVAVSLGTAQEPATSYNSQVRHSLQDTSYSSDGAKFIFGFCTVWGVGFGGPGLAMTSHDNTEIKTLGWTLCFIASLPVTVLLGMAYSDCSKGKKY